MQSILANWKKMLVFGLIFAIVSALIMVLLGMPWAAVVRTTIISTLIVMGMSNFIGIFPKR